MINKKLPLLLNYNDINFMGYDMGKLIDVFSDVMVAAYCVMAGIEENKFTSKYLQFEQKKLCLALN